MLCTELKNWTDFLMQDYWMSNYAINSNHQFKNYLNEEEDNVTELYLWTIYLIWQEKKMQSFQERRLLISWNI